MNKTNNQTISSNEQLKKFVDSYDRIFIDTCSLMDDCAELFFSNISPFLKAANKQIIVPTVVYKKELRDCTAQTEDKETKARAKRAIALIESLKSSGAIQIFGDPSDLKNIADNIFKTVITRFRYKYNMALITQDNGLNADIERLKDDVSVTRGLKRVDVWCLKKDGVPDKFLGTNTKKNAESLKSQAALERHRMALEYLQAVRSAGEEGYSDRLWQISSLAAGGYPCLAEVLYPLPPQPEELAPLVPEEHLCVLDIFDDFCRVAYKNKDCTGSWTELDCRPVESLNIRQKIGDWTNYEPGKSCWHLVGEADKTSKVKSLLQGLDVRSVTCSEARLTSPAACAIHLDLTAAELTVASNYGFIKRFPSWGAEAWWQSLRLEGQLTDYLLALSNGKDYLNIMPQDFKPEDYVKALLCMVPPAVSGAVVHCTGWLSSLPFSKHLLAPLQERGYTVRFNYSYDSFFKK